MHRLGLFKSLAVLTLLLLSGCATKLGVVKPEAQVTDASIQSLSFDSVTLAVQVEVTNPNRFNIPTGQLALNLRVDGKQIAQASTTEDVSLKAKESTQMIVPVTVPYSSLFDLVDSARNGNAFQYDVVGHLSVPMPLLGDIKVPLNHSGKAPIPQLPKVSISQFSITDLSLTRLQADLVLHVKNNNTFALNLNALNLNIKADGKSLAQVAAEPNSALKAEQGQDVRVPVSISTKEAGFALFRSLTQSQKVEWQVEGTGNLEGAHGLSLKDFGFDVKELLSALR